MKRYWVTICLLLAALSAVAQTADKSLQSNDRLQLTGVPSLTMPQSDWLFTDTMHADEYAYDLLQPDARQFVYLGTQNSIYGQQLTFRMQFADWLSLRLGVLDDRQAEQLFLSYPNQKTNTQPHDLGYQLGVSSVLNITPNWRFGVDLATGQVSGSVMGLYQDQLETTSFGLGIRNQRFGASLHSDFASSQQNSDLYRSSIDLQVDWHFNQDGTLSFGARKNMNDNTATNLDRFTGTVPYIKFKHNL